MRRAAFLIAFVVAGAFYAYLRHVASDGPTATTIADVAGRGAQTRTLPEGLPDLSARGWHALGGRRDDVGGRGVLSAQYAQDDKTITIARMADTDGLSEEPGTSVERVSGDLQLSWSGPSDRLQARLPLHGHQTVLTGEPASESLRRELTRIAAAMGRTS